MAENAKSRLSRLAAPLVDIFGLSAKLAVTLVLLGLAFIVLAIFWFFHSAPPTTIVISAGAPGSPFQTNAIRYQDFLAHEGVKLKILPSQGSLDNLHRLDNPSSHVDIGFIQGGITNSADNTNKLVSLGSISYEPLLIFYRSESPVDLLSGFTGRRLMIGPEGSGTRSLALQLLALNGITNGGKTAFVEVEADQVADALLDGKVDAVFLMSDSSSREVMFKLMHSSDVRLYDFVQADAYTRRISYVNKLVLPEGSMDFGKNIPSHDVNLIGPTVEIIARPGLDPALSDLLIAAAKKVNGKPSLFSRRSEFPAPIEHDFPISPDATRYYTSGEKFFYRWMPFWLASLVGRVLVSFVPLIVLLPGLRLIPAALKWRMQMRIQRWYRALLALERGTLIEGQPGQREQLLGELNRIEGEVNKMKVPASYAGQFYGLRGDIQFVRGRLQQAKTV